MTIQSDDAHLVDVACTYLRRIDAIATATRRMLRADGPQDVSSADLAVHELMLAIEDCCEVAYNAVADLKDDQPPLRQMKPSKEVSA